MVHKHNSTMISVASPSATDPKMNESLVHLAQMSSTHAYTQDWYFKRPHLTIIDGDIRSDSGFWVVFGWFRGCGTSDTRLPRRKLGKKTHPNHGGCRCPTVAMVPPPPPPPHTTISKHAARQVYVVKTREYNCFYYLLAI